MSGRILPLAFVALLAAGLWLAFGGGRAGLGGAGGGGAVASEAYAPGSAEPSVAIPGGGLEAHEGVRGAHTLARHVGKTPEELERRAIEEGKREVSTFPDAATANRSVAAVLHRKQADVRRWLASGPRQNEDFEARLDLPAGLVYRRDTRRTVPGRTVRVVLAPSDRFPAGFSVLTAYVTLP